MDTRRNRLLLPHETVLKTLLLELPAFLAESSWCRSRWYFQVRHHRSSRLTQTTLPLELSLFRKKRQLQDAGCRKQALKRLLWSVGMSFVQDSDNWPMKAVRELLGVENHLPFSNGEPRLTDNLEAKHTMLYVAQTVGARGTS